MPPGAEPLHLGRLFRFSEGRWNVRGEYACLYTALTRDGARRKLDGRATPLLVPSGAVSGESNLIVYFDIVAPKQIVIDNGPDRERVDP